MTINVEAVLEFSRDLQRARDLTELLHATRGAVMANTRYRSVWIAHFEHTVEGEMVRVLAIAGPAEPLVYAQAPLIPAAGDAMLAEIKAGKKPVVVVDARTDPRTNKKVVALHQNRTILNVPLLLAGDVIGALGAGTNGDEPCLEPTPDELELLTVFGVQLAPALDRVRLVDREAQANRERDLLRRRLQQLERVETLGLLAGGVAHDFNNLLTVIMNALHFLSEVRLSEACRRDVKDAMDAAARAADLTRQLLAMGRKQALRLEATDWKTRLQALQRLLARLLPETVDVVVQAEPDLPWVLADGNQLDQVVVNLCINARDAMPTGGRVTLRLRHSQLTAAPGVAQRVKTGPAVALDVVDSGVGMPPEVVERIFEPFFTTKDVGVGTGLGLAVAQGVVDQHRGLLECQSQPGQGSTFTVTLPVATEQDLGAPRPPEENHVSGQGRILAADDDPFIRDLLQRVLGEAGYQVTVVPDGRAALELARAQEFDLVLLDAIMPRLSGRLAFEQIHPLRPGASFLFMTGYAAETLPPEFLGQHGIEVVEKPWLPGQLLAAVRRALYRPPAAT